MVAEIHKFAPEPAQQPFALIEDFLDLTSHDVTPPIFRKWAAIAMIAGALERRVWSKNGDHVVFPNLYTLLVAPPGIGKFVIETVRDLWTETMEPKGPKVPAFKVAPDSMTKASLIDNLAKAKGMRLTLPKDENTYHSLLVASEEFSVLMPSYDMEFIGTLNSLYMNKSVHKESRRTGSVREVDIVRPQLNLLAGVQPAYMAAAFPEEIWQSGISRRFLMVYSNEQILMADLFAESPNKSATRRRVLDGLSHLSDLVGKFTWETEAAEKMNEWYQTGQEPKPTHSKLRSYCNTRPVFLLKLSLIFACASGETSVIRLRHLDLAMDWLFEAERLMPDIFREMVGRSDKEVLDELWTFIQEMWIRLKRPPQGVPSQKVYHFLSQRVPSDKISKILELAERANILKNNGGSAWLPYPKHTHGME